MALLAKKTNRKSAALAKTEIERAIKYGIESFFEQRKAHIPDFVNEHFRYPGCWQTNRRAFGWDLVRAPINLFWAPLYVLFALIFAAMSFAGHKTAKSWIGRLPTGMTTEVQRAINRAIQKRLLDKDELKDCIIEQLKHLPELDQKDLAARDHLLEHLNQVVDEALKQLILTRTASADIANTLFTTAVGALAFKQFTPGGIGVGLLLAALWVNETAKQNFFLGSTIGGWYYSLFPPAVSWFDQAAGIAFAMFLLAILASFSGLITDPIQSRLGLHSRRLRKMLEQTKQDLLTRSESQFKPLDPFVARILELFDAVKVSL